MEKIDLKALGAPLVERIAKEWMLVTAGTADGWNTMTASWGGVGWLWNRPVAFVFVRPERYTHEFIERHERLTLSFLSPEERDVLSFCGSHSGRDCDKAQATGLRPLPTPGGSVTFEQARLTLECRKLFKSEMAAADFLDKECLERWYGPGEGQSLHTVYVVEIEHAYSKDL
ncbi:MAG TPA: flavin reductase [Candidatus Caccomonas pullistercoris]|nr:flavin reductase [Candidatus Caccomonas pullistercoris]